MSFKYINYSFSLFFMLVAITCFSQSANILKGTSEFRNIILNEYMINAQQIEKIRQKLDSISVTNHEFERFCYNLSFVSRNLDNDELRGRQYMVNALKSNPAYKNLTEKELIIVIDNFELIFLNKLGIWKERYPHKLDAKSLRLKEISQYGVTTGDRILHFSALNNHLCEILYLSYDSLQISYNPYRFEFKENKIFDAVSSKKQKPSSSLSYLLEEFPKPLNNQLYDKVVFECLGILFFRSFPNFKKKMKTIHKLLTPEGELIVSANYNTIMFDGPVPEISRIDKKIERILDRGFKLKERIFSENEYIVYKFSKVDR